MKIFKQVCDQIRSQTNLEYPEKNKFHIIVFPKYISSYENELEQLGLYHDIVRLHSFQWMPLCLDEGVLSLEIPNLYMSLYVYNNTMLLPSISKALWQLCFVIGKPKVVITVGQYANTVFTQYEKFCEDKGDSDKTDCDFGALLILDRNIDYPSALLTPGTYAALLGEVYNVRTGVCEKSKEKPDTVDEKFNPLPEKHQVNFSLDSVQDTVYADLKNRHFTEVIAVLGNLTKQLKSESLESESLSSKEMALDEIKHYVQTQLQATKSKQFITNHLLAAESIINVLGYRYENQKYIEQSILQNSDKATNLNFLEELLITENNKYITLRLFCLLSITQMLTESEIKSFWRKYLHQFGFHCGFAYNNLINTGFIPEFTQNLGALNITGKLKIPIFSSNNFYVAAKNLKQIPPNPDKVDVKHPTCPSYVYGGTYIPLVTQIISLLLNSKSIEELKSDLEGIANIDLRNNEGYPLSCRNLLIYLVGGITYAEIASCNLLETLTGAKIYVLSDRIITGNDIMKGILSYPK